jgi:hypothetical protein
MPRTATASAATASAATASAATASAATASVAYMMGALTRRWRIPQPGLR